MSKRGRPKKQASSPQKRIRHDNPWQPYGKERESQARRAKLIAAIEANIKETTNEHV